MSVLGVHSSLTRAGQVSFVVRPQEGARVDLLTDKPTGGVIDVTLSWPAPPEGRIRRAIDQVLMALFLWGWAASLVRPAGQIANGKADPDLVARAALWTLFGGALVWVLLASLWSSFRPARPESVRLGAEALRHDPGGRRWCWGRRPDRAPIQVTRSDLRGVVLETVGGRPRLYLDLGDGRREIGAALGEMDREWVFAVLQRWHEAEPVAARDPARMTALRSS
jgi:hypothetical protein